MNGEHEALATIFADVFVEVVLALHQFAYP